MPLVPETPRPDNDGLSGDTVVDVKRAVSVRLGLVLHYNMIAETGQTSKILHPVDDFKKLPEVPCARNALMNGIAGGSAIGAIRYLGAGENICAPPRYSC